MKVFMKTLGCKVNTFDTHALENQFKNRGHELVDSPLEADITVINTCSVTAAAEKEARYLLRRFRRDKPEAFQVVTGCYAQINSGFLAKMPEVDFIVPNEAKDQLLPLLEERLSLNFAPGKAGDKFPAHLQEVNDNKQGHFKAALTLFDNPRSERSRAFLKIQDGCNGFCSYCQIPYARGASRSVPPRAVLEQVDRLLGEGVREIVLTGIHIGDYGRDLATEEGGDELFLSLLEALLRKAGLARLRISSLEPAEVSAGLLELLARHGEKFCDHFHLPLQAGSDRILKLMNRKYDKATYRQLLSMIRHYFPQAQITADVIPGFPGEGEAEFQEGLDFIEACELSALHVFPYSKRPNTAALRMPGHCEPEIIKERARRLRELSTRRLFHFSKQFVGQEASVHWESYDPSQKRWLGKTKNYLQVLSPENFSGEAGLIQQVSLKGFLQPDKLLAVPL